MNPPDWLVPEVCFEQVYLMERDTGLLCRVLGLYGARGLDILNVEYAYAARSVMALRVRLSPGAADTSEFADTVRVLMAKVETLVGVIAAADHRVAARGPSISTDQV